ncbi:hypothetical protein GCM10011391_13870 [Pullulanibacillus camelliae]|uniref:Flagellar protein FlaG n=1 Tax=Pullulanibacillus camelliae TaxID=1707096 RepID=A0A8J2YG20_9BACL|nr:flagellar protein FlaG [Pullulanibacillus camelliae]GGE36284.1 hypothetical protein GCM10011391_13870 [Pullulanibacillus camelliae]
MSMELTVASGALVQSSSSNLEYVGGHHQAAGLQETDHTQGQQQKHLLGKAVDQLNQMIQIHHTELHFVLHDKLDTYYVQVVDEDSQQVLREIPPKKILDIYASMLQHMGLLVDDKI